MLTVPETPLPLRISAEVELPVENSPMELVDLVTPAPSTRKEDSSSEYWYTPPMFPDIEERDGHDPEDSIAEPDYSEVLRQSLTKDPSDQQENFAEKAKMYEILKLGLEDRLFSIELPYKTILMVSKPANSLDTIEDLPCPEDTSVCAVRVLGLKVTEYVFNKTKGSRWTSCVKELVKPFLGISINNLPQSQRSLTDALKKVAVDNLKNWRKFGDPEGSELVNAENANQL